ncbi:MAG: PAS domain S-box protein, partial [Marinobacter sp.]|nr:PAS domain S-box protein [Marinobacter sp.]
QRALDTSRVMITLGILGITVTLASWHLLRLQASLNLQQEAGAGNDFLLPPLILLTGVSLSFLMMLTHLYWRESEHRSDSLQRHLEQEQRLRQTNERILNFSRDLLCTVDREGRFSMISPACETIFGYKQAELIGQPADRLMLPQDRAESMELARALISGERQQLRNYRNRHRHRDGHVVTMSWMVEWSREEKALFCLGRDITDQLVAETLTREREQFFALSPDMFCIVDLNNHFFELNQGFVNALGFQREELLGTSYLELVFEDDRPKVIDAVKQMMEGQSIHNLHIRARDRQGKIHWLQLSAILSADDLIYVVGRDNTDDRETRLKLQESEALLRIAEHAAHIGGWALDVITGEIRWSDAVCDIHDLSTGNTPGLSEALEYYHPDDRPVIEDAVRLCIETGIPFDEELRIRTARGRERWVRVIGHAVRDEAGNWSRLQGAMQDITSARRAIEQVQHL